MASSKKAIYAAIVGNFAIAVTKFIGSAISGSSAMLTEGIHSLVDTGNGGLLLLGIRRSKQPADETHPFGYGKELYFWTLIVAVLIFAVGGGISIYEGIKHALHPAAMETQMISLLGLTFSAVTLNYMVLSLAIVFEGFAGWTALTEFSRLKGEQSYWQAIRTSKDPTTFTVLFEDSAAMAGLLVALLGVFLSHELGMPVLDGIASIAIGVILCAVAVFLVYESKGLLVGEAADPVVRESVRRIAREDPDVTSVERVMTMHFGPYSVLLTLEVYFREGSTADDVEAAVDRIERKIYEAHEDVQHILIEAESLAARRRDGRRRGGHNAPVASEPAASGHG